MLGSESLVCIVKLLISYFSNIGIVFLLRNNSMNMKTLLTTLVGLLFALQPAKATVELVCPQDYYLDCDDDISNLSIFGNAYYVEYGVSHDAGLPAVEYYLSNCGTGHINRIWRIEDSQWNWHSCTQRISISGGRFRYSDITWPRDTLHLQGCDVSYEPDDLPREYQKPSWNYVDCSHVASSYRDREFAFGPDCKKILREWTVIDWCSYVAGGAKGIFTWTQTIKISRDQAPILSCAKEVTVKSNRCDSAYVNIPGVDVEGESCSGGYDVSNDSPYAYANKGMASGVYPVGKTIVNYAVEYACGSVVRCYTEVTVLPPDPVPYCLADLHVALMAVDSDGNGLTDDGMVEVWAKDLDIGSYHPCNDRPLKISFSADVNDNVRVFTCADVGYNQVQMWVTDHRGHQSYCVANIDIQNNAANIPDCAPDVGARQLFSGKVMNINHEPIEKTLVMVRDQNPMSEEITKINNGDTLTYGPYTHQKIYHLMTNYDGIFGTHDITKHRNYQVSAYKETDLSTLDNDDLNLLLDHIQEDVPFSNPYTYHAADIDENGTIDITDYKILRDIISGKDKQWPQERQWVFYVASELEESMTEEGKDTKPGTTVDITELKYSPTRDYFIGIKKGELTDSESL